MLCYNQLSFAVLCLFVCLLKKNVYFHEPVFCFPLVYLIKILQVISLWQTKDISLISPVDDICWDFALLHHSGAALSTKKSETDGAGLDQQLAESAVHVMLEDPHDPISQGSKRVWAYGLWRQNPPIHCHLNHNGWLHCSCGETAFTQPVLQTTVYFNFIV